MFWSPLKYLEALSRDRREKRETKLLLRRTLEELQSLKVLAQILLIELRQKKHAEEDDSSPPDHRGS